MKKNQIKNKVLKKNILLKYNCVNKYKSNFMVGKKLWKEIKVSVSKKEFAKNDIDYLYDTYLIEKLSKYLMKGGNNYKVRKNIHNSFKNFKLIVKVHPLIVYYYIAFSFLISIEFRKIRKGRQYFNAPKTIMEEDIFLLRTIKLFSNVMKLRWDWESDLQSKLFHELFYIMFFMKRSKFYNMGLKKYYVNTEEGVKHISGRYRW